ncbi:MAG: hypothetical protein M1820_009027 [Bogoriella megaspora]|nr:MAG: hypothetical protein M1820_009027 [Bogoriella megaspora]
MSSSDPHQGGSLEDMASTGTKIPGDAGVQNIIPSVPRPDQITEDAGFSKGGLGATDLQGAADNATDIPRRNKDIAATSEVLTGTGDQMPVQIESKNLHFGANEPLSKGHDRYDKHSRQKESDLERYQGEGADMDPAADEESEGYQRTENAANTHASKRSDV